MPNQLVLRTLQSPYSDTTKGSVLTHADLDNNMIFLKGISIESASVANGSLNLKQYNGTSFTVPVGSGSGPSSASTFYGEFINLIGLISTGDTVAITYDATLSSNGITTTSGSSIITVQHSGTYEFEYYGSLGMFNGDTTYIWSRVNGIDIPNSSNLFADTTDGLHGVPLSNSIILNLNAGDTVEFMLLIISTRYPDLERGLYSDDNGFSPVTPAFRVVAKTIEATVYTGGTISVPSYTATFLNLSGLTIPDSATTITYDTIQSYNGISLANGSQIVISKAGQYEFELTAQFSWEVIIWVRVNGVDVANSTGMNTSYSRNSYNNTTISKNILLNLNAGDYVEFITMCDLVGDSAYFISLAPLDSNGNPITAPVIPAVRLDVKSIQSVMNSSVDFSTYSYYGMFSNTTGLYGPLPPTPITYDIIQASNGVITTSGSSQITVQHSGMYEFEYHAHINRDGDIIAYVNGIELPDLYTIINSSDVDSVASYSFLLNLNAGDNVDFNFSTHGSNTGNLRKFTVVAKSIQNYVSTGPVTGNTAYATFLNTTGTTFDVPVAFVFDTSLLTNKITIQNGSQIIVQEGGKYEITYNGQFQNDGITTLFPRVNGIDIPNLGFTTSHFPSNSLYNIISNSFILNLNAGDYVEIIGTSTAGSSIIPESGGGLIPDTPALSLIIKSLESTTIFGGGAGYLPTSGGKLNGTLYAPMISGCTLENGTNVIALGGCSHAEGNSSVTGLYGYHSSSVVNGVITLDASYGDVTGTLASFYALGYTYILFSYDLTTSQQSQVVSNIFDGTNTIITITDTYNLSAAMVGASVVTNYIFPTNNQHAEGYNTFAWGDNSHSEGNSTFSFGNYSHSEGRNTESYGWNSHAEGYGSQAIGYASHAEGTVWGEGGRAPVANGTGSHAEGYGTQANGFGSHAEGRSSVAIGDGSHAEGYATQTSGSTSHAEGQDTVAIGFASHAEGVGTVAAMDYQHASGTYNTTGNTTSLFVVGSGTDDLNRADAFRVDLLSGNTSTLATLVLPSVVGLGYANDTQAAANGIPIGGLYQSGGGIIRIRLT